MTAMEGFTEAQVGALDRANEILREHFEASLVAVVTTLEGDEGKEISNVRWAGGRIQALGLCAEANDWILHSGNPDNTPHP
jgi:hypothetical protein